MDFLIDPWFSEFDGEIRFSPWGKKSYYIIPDTSGLSNMNHGIEVP